MSNPNYKPVIHTAICIGGPLDGTFIDSEYVHLVPVAYGVYHEYWYEWCDGKADYIYKYKGYMYK